MSNLLQFGIRLDRERFVTLLARVGNPHQQLRCVHVAGTNGKGSTTTFIASILRAAGYKVGSYLSPYVFDMRERIQINDGLITREDFARWVTTLRPHIEALAATDLGQTTEFELKTAVAFCCFAEQAVDFAVIEVGIGGRLDATNVIPSPLVAVITSIGLDHVNLLGDTLGRIAREKAGIIKRGTRACITAVEAAEPLEVIQAKAKSEDVPLLRVGTGELSFARHEYDRSTGTVSITLAGDQPAGMAIALQHLRLRLRGPFQADNAAAAAAAVDVLRREQIIRITPDAFRRGLEEATLPGRFQIAHPGDDRRAALVLDGAHNEDGARVLAEALRAEFGSQKRFRFVIGMRKNHEPLPHLTQMAPLASHITVTAPPFKPAPAEEIADAARALGLETEIIEPASEAIRRTWERATSGEVVVVTGSFYTVGETPEALLGSVH